MNVSCINCQRRLDVTTTNYLINTRPWCGACAEPHVPRGATGDVGRSGWGNWHHRAIELLRMLKREALEAVDMEAHDSDSLDIEVVMPSQAAERFARFVR